MLETLTHSDFHEADSRDSSRALVRMRNGNYPGVHLATLSVHCRLQSPTLSILGLVLALDGRLHASRTIAWIRTTQSVTRTRAVTEAQGLLETVVYRTIHLPQGSALPMVAIETTGIMILDMEPRLGLLYVLSANTRRRTSMLIYPRIRENQNITATG